MAEKKGVGHAYNVDFLNVVFAASSLFLFLSVVWMVWDDYDREWKHTQRRFSQLEYQVTQAQLQQASRSIDRTKLQQLQAAEAAARKNVTANQKKVDDLQSRLADVENRLYRITQQYQSTKANYDHDKYDFESSRAAGDSSAARKGQRVQEEEKQLNDLDLQVQKTTAERAVIQKEHGQYTGQVDAVAKQVEGLTTQQNRLRTRLTARRPSAG